MGDITVLKIKPRIFSVICFLLYYFLEICIDVEYPVNFFPQKIWDNNKH